MSIGKHEHKVTGNRLQATTHHSSPTPKLPAACNRQPAAFNHRAGYLILIIPNTQKEKYLLKYLEN